MIFGKELNSIIQQVHLKSERLREMGGNVPRKNPQVYRNSNRKMHRHVFSEQINLYRRRGRNANFAVLIILSLGGRKSN